MVESPTSLSSRWLDPAKVGFENKFLNNSNYKVELMLLDDLDYDHGELYR